MAPALVQPRSLSRIPDSLVLFSNRAPDAMVQGPGSLQLVVKTKSNETSHSQPTWKPKIASDIMASLMMASSVPVVRQSPTAAFSSPGSEMDPDRVYGVSPEKSENSSGTSPESTSKTPNNSLTPGQIIAERLEREMDAKKNSLPIPNPDFCLDYLKDEPGQITPDLSEGSSFNYHGDTLSPEHPRNFPVTPVIEDGREIFYCHLCSYSGPSRVDFTDHLDSHFEHKCDQCDYTSRTEGRLKQHIQKFHLHEGSNVDSNEGNMADLADGSMLSDSPTAPQRTSGRQKIYRCKQCDFSATAKEEFWRHARLHIKEDKLLQCPKCEFVTEYKHHLEYHLRNHFGSKPFKCNKCTYACVNKSMLNSHMKSHTNIYQYRCADCTYATKYCHSLKLHLRKYSHKPASIINLDGTIDHDTSSLLTMKRSGPAKSNPPRTKEEPRPIAPTSNGVMSYPPNSGPPNMMPLWSFPSGLRPAPPLMPANLGNFFRRMLPLPQLMKPAVPLSSDAQNSTVQKCKVCDIEFQTKESLVHHMLSDHPASSAELLNELGLMNGLKSEPNTLTTTSTLPTPALSTAPFPSTTPIFGYPPVSMFNGLTSSNTPSESKTSSVPSLPSLSPISAPPSLKTPSSVDRPLDLTKTEVDQADSVTSNNSTQSSIPVVNSLLESSRKRSRKGKAYKLDALCLKLQEKVDPEKREDNDGVFDSLAVDEVTEKRQKLDSDDRPPTVSSISSEPVTLEKNENNNNNDSDDEKLEEERSHEAIKPMADKGDLPVGSNERYSCPYCDISFTNCVMYTMHMGYHGYQNPFKCNMCGEESQDKVSFFLHIARAAHN